MKVLSEKDAEIFLEKNGFPVAKRIIAKNLEQTIKAAKKMGFPLVLKIVSKKILHKSDVHGVKLNLKNIEEVKRKEYIADIVGGYAAIAIKYPISP